MISYRRRRRRHYERNSTTTINVKFLNLNGARKASKWAELYTAMSSEAITVFAVAETHLRNLEEPPVQSGWQWAGCNRTGESRRGGGVGVICDLGQWLHVGANGGLLRRTYVDIWKHCWYPSAGRRRVPHGCTRAT